MRVLFWTEMFWPYLGGAELFSANLLRALRDRGYEIQVATSHGNLDLPSEDELDGIPVWRHRFREALHPDAMQDLMLARQRTSELLRRFAPDLVHLDGIGPSAFFPVSTASAHPAPTLVRVNRDLVLDGLAGRPQGLVDRVLRAADWVTAVSAAALAQVRELVPEIEPRSSLIRTGVIAPSVEPSAPPPGRDPVLLCIGRLVEAKGFDTAIEAMALLRARGRRVRMIIAGDGSDRPILESQAAAGGITGAVEFAGWIAPDRVADSINRANIVLVPSRREGLPHVPIQAALMERPVIGTRTGGIPEIVSDRETGLLVDVDDTAALAAAIEHLLDEPRTAAAMGAAARRRALEMFDWTRCVDAYDHLYQKIGRT